MVFSITIYGNSVLRKVTTEVSPEDKGLDEFITNMFETMEKSDGIGLAAPQVNSTRRVFVVDGTPLADDHPELASFKQAFINPEIIKNGDEEVFAEEGCLSIPNIREEVKRPDYIKIRYKDQHFNEHTEEYTGIASRIIQHELDHLNGVLFTDLISPLRKRMLRKKLNAIAKGKFEVSYKTKVV